MLTSTLRRLRDGDGVAGEEVWSYYGIPITLSAP